MIVNAEYGMWGTGCADLKGYFFDFMQGLSTWGLTQWRQNKISRAKRIIAETKRLEREGYPVLAEAEIQRLVSSTTSKGARLGLSG